MWKNDDAKHYLPVRIQRTHINFQWYSFILYVVTNTQSFLERHSYLDVHSIEELDLGAEGIVTRSILQVYANPSMYHNSAPA